MSKIVAPGEGHLYHGVFPGGSDGTATACELDEYERTVERQVAWVQFSHEWGLDTTFPAQTVTWIHDRGAAPYIRLMLRSTVDQFVCEPKYTLKAIANGEFECELTAWGKAAASFGVPLICEWGSEANGLWFPWNAVHNGAAKGGPLFQCAYRTVIDTIRRAGATRITWVFHVNHQDNPCTAWNKLEQYDPGEDWVDWIGVSLYGAIDTTDEVTVFSDRMSRVYERLTSLPGCRPIMVSEMGIAAGNPHKKPVDWTCDALTSLLDGRWPRIRGFSWWNESWRNADTSLTQLRVQCIEGLPELFRAQLVDNPKVVDQPIAE